MFIAYIKDMKSWLLFFLLSLGFTDLLIWLDSGIDLKTSSVVYLNVVLLVVFILFLIWRYQKELQYIKRLTTLVNVMETDWLETLPEPAFIRDRLTNDTLRQLTEVYSKKLADLNKVNIIESDYTAAWVHEVKAPLTAMKLKIDAHRNDPVIRKIESDWLRVHLLIDQQLSISRLPTLEADYLLEKTIVQRLVSAEVRELASWCLEKNIAVEFEGDLEAADIEVVTDVKWCRFMIRQLLTNAVKYSPVNGTIIISVNVNPFENVIVTIKDEGPGIQPHELPRIFDKGFTGGTGRIHNAATGLGLYLAQMVATKIGITLTVQSETAQGTAVSIMFTRENEFDTMLM